MRAAPIGAFVIGVVLGCASEEGEPPAPRHDDPCMDGEPARCGFGDGLDATKNAVLVCDGGTWSTGIECGAFSECIDDTERGAVLCEQGDEAEIAYGEHAGNCAVDGAQACSFERDFVLVCEGGKWNIATNCSSEVLHCALQDASTGAGMVFVCA